MHEKLLAIENLSVKPLYWIDSSRKVKTSGAFCVTDGLNYYGTVGGRYKPISYNEVYEFAKTATGYPLKIVGSASNKENAKGILTCEAPLVDKVGSDDINLYLNIVNSLDGSTPVGLMVTPVRVCCMNQFQLMKNKAFIKLNYRHTNHGLVMMQSQSKLIQEIVSCFTKQLVIAQKLEQVKSSMKQGSILIEDMCKNSIINERSMHIALDIWNNPTRKEDKQRNEWTLFNAITEPINRYLEKANRWSTVRELNRVGEFFARRV